MVSNCLKECLLNLGVVSPTEVGQWHKGDKCDFLSRIDSTTDFFHNSGQPDGGLTGDSSMNTYR